MNAPRLRYERLLHELATGRPRVIADYTEWLLPHELPDDPEWPAPLDARELTDLLESMEAPQRLLAALAALDLVRAVAERAAQEWQPPVSTVALDSLVCWWLDGDDLVPHRDLLHALADQRIAESDVKNLQQVAPGYAPALALAGERLLQDHPALPLAIRRGFHRAEGYRHLALGLIEALQGSHGTAWIRMGFGGAAIAAVQPISRAVLHSARVLDPDGDPSPFLAHWWRRCRCRLAFRASLQVDLRQT